MTFVMSDFQNCWDGINIEKHLNNFDGWQWPPLLLNFSTENMQLLQDTLSYTQIRTHTHTHWLIIFMIYVHNMTAFLWA